MRAAIETVMAAMALVVEIPCIIAMGLTAQRAAIASIIVTEATVIVRETVPTIAMERTVIVSVTARLTVMAHTAIRLAIPTTTAMVAIQR